MNESIHYKLLDVASNGKNLLKPVITEELGVMMSDHGLTLDEAVIFSFVLKYSLQSSSVELEMFESELIKKGDRNYIKILKDLKNMEKKGVILLNSDGRRRRGRKDSFNPTISIDDSVFSSVVLGEDIYGKTDFSDTYSVLEAMDEIIEKRSDKKISEERFIRDFEVFFDKIDIRLPLKRLAVKYSEIERAMLFRACVTKLKGNGRDDCNNFIAGIYDSLKAVAMVMRKIYQDTMPAFRDKTLQLVESGNFFSIMTSPDFELTEKAYEKIFESKMKKKNKEFRARFSEHLINEKITRELYFDTDLKIKVDTISSALGKDRFKEVVKELKAHGFAPGVVSLLYGYPGTGKTATVHEIARRTKRDILQVDIANINDKYVGESEKRLKEVFNEYRRAVRILPRTPILLFNEADALISRRINVEDSVDQMRNNMQNIILEELEKFDGIFFATTNLTHNMDDAFSRRFLYKIEFTKPSPEIRKKIWESKMKDIPEDWIEKLSFFDLTGGQIDNIVRKYMIDSVLLKNAGFDSLQRMCREEAEYKKDRSRHIGFCA
jgi:AAA+ superfamily predicted ATPase